MDTGTTIAFATLVIAVVGGLAAALLRFGKVEAAAEVARQAMERADAAQADLSEFKERVARDYATASLVSATESRVVAAIDRLGDRIDRILEGRSPVGRTRPAPK